MGGKRPGESVDEQGKASVDRDDMPRRDPYRQCFDTRGRNRSYEHAVWLQQLRELNVLQRSPGVAQNAFGDRLDDAGYGVIVRSPDFDFLRFATREQLDVEVVHLLGCAFGRGHPLLRGNRGPSLHLREVDSI
ncbi:hypothetical protein UB31_00280 [Bradyrhizobium sp. LTSP849]|nr:hypothetical protein UB31_00280 [Bradyrhizobium sp. LTSP849]